MKVFITIPWFLPAYKAGGPIQSVANLVNQFTEDVDFFIFCGDVDLNNEPLENITKGEWVIFNEHTKIWYAPKENLSQTLAGQIELLKPEIVYIIGLFDWHFNIVPLLFSKAEKKILSIRGMLHPGALTQKKLKKRVFLKALNLFNISDKVIFHATDKVEETFIKNEFGEKSSIVIAGNFARNMVKNKPLEKNVGFLKMVTIALISPMKNHLPVLKALMLCTENINYNIYGPVKEAQYWEECVTQINLLPKNITVQYHGEILPKNVSDILAENHLFIMPSKSENFGHALAEALASGHPVITSFATPWNDLQQNKAGINVEPTEKDISEAIRYYALMDNEEYKKYVEGACNYSDSKLNLPEKIIAYKNLFSISSK